MAVIRMAIPILLMATIVEILTAKILDMMNNKQLQATELKPPHKLGLATVRLGTAHQQILTENLTDTTRQA